MGKLKTVLIPIIIGIITSILVVLPDSSTSRADTLTTNIPGDQSYTVPDDNTVIGVVRYSYSATTLDEMKQKQSAREAAEQAKTSPSSPGWKPPHVVADPGSAKAIAHDMVLARGWSEDDFGCLVVLWQRESGWNVAAHNSSSGAYGIPQALPGNKMSSAGADWETNPTTQIVWGLNYISGRYGSPCGAWSHSENTGWY